MKKKNKGGRPKSKVQRIGETIRLSPAEKAAFKRTAEAYGLPMITWLRCLGRQASGLDPDSQTRLRRGR